MTVRSIDKRPEGLDLRTRTKGFGQNSSYASQTGGQEAAIRTPSSKHRPNLPAYISLPLIRHNPDWERVNCQRTPFVVPAG
jgi:hypothetical protein